MNTIYTEGLELYIFVVCMSGFPRNILRITRLVTDVIFCDGVTFPYDSLVMTGLKYCDIIIARATAPKNF